MAKVITNGNVNVQHPDTYEFITLTPGSTVPKWAEKLVTNPALFAQADEPAGEQTPSTPPQTPPADPNTSTEPTLPELRTQAEELGLSSKGSKAQIATRIEKKLAENAEAAKKAADDAAKENGTPAEGDGTDRASLEARAEALGIEFESEHSDEELIALIEAEQE